MSVAIPIRIGMEVLASRDENAKRIDRITNGLDENPKQFQSELVGPGVEVDLNLENVCAAAVTDVSSLKPKELAVALAVQESENIPAVRTSLDSTIKKASTSASPLLIGKAQSPRHAETRYYCRSCCCYVEQSQRRHDTLTHKPLRSTKWMGRKNGTPTPATSFDCDICKRTFDSKAGLSSHIRRMHGTKQNLKDYNDEDKKEYFCFECNMRINEDNYIAHLIQDDQIRRNSALQGSNDKNNRKSESMIENNCEDPDPDADAEMKEWNQRRFIYLNPQDPKRNGPDAMILCDKCPFFVFSTTRKFREHSLATHRIDGMQVSQSK